MSDIFLSYNENDRETVRRLAETFRSVGWTVWWDRRIPAGGTWRTLLEAELQSMRCMVVVWSAHSIRSEWVHEEATEGRQLGRLVPVAIEAVRPPPGFREIQCADLVGWDGTTTWLNMRTLIEDIESLIGKPVAETPKVVTPPQVAIPAPPPPAAPPLFEVSVTSSPPLPSRGQVTAFGVGLFALIAAGLWFGLHRPPADDTSKGPAPSGQATAVEARPASTGAPPVQPAESGREPMETASTNASAKPVDVPSPGTRVAATTKGGSKSAPGVTTNARCEDLQMRASLGPLSAEDLQFLRKCR